MINLNIFILNSDKQPAKQFAKTVNDDLEDDDADEDMSGNSGKENYHHTLSKI